MAIYTRSLFIKRMVKRKSSSFFFFSNHRLIFGFFFKAAKEFQVSLYQALVLLLFNEHHELGYKDIQEQTKIRS